MKLVITGGSGEIGRALVSRVAHEGHEVLNLDLRKPEVPLDGETYVEADLTDETATRELARSLAATHAVDGLVNNAGIVRPAPLESATTDDLDAVVAVNLRAPLILTQEFLPHMRSRKFGRIVNIASRAALGKVDRTVYSATKAGLIGMTRTWALEAAAAGITVNAVSPGPIATQLFHTVNPPGEPRTEEIIRAVPVRRMGTPDDIAHAVAFLLDERAGFITGQNVNLCGGMTVGLAS